MKTKDFQDLFYQILKPSRSDITFKNFAGLEKWKKIFQELSMPQGLVLLAGVNQR